MATPHLIEDDTVVICENDPQSYKLFAGSSTVIRAWAVTIRGANSTPGQDVTIVADSITFEPGSSIVTDGALGTPDWQPGLQPQTPDAPGSNGLAGGPGGDGQNAGGITLIAREIDGTVAVSAVGGRAGRGQDGGNGRRGADYTGPIPSLILVRDASSLPNPLQQGSPGQTGGTGGPAGPPGNEGNGGNLNIHAGNVSAINVQANLSGGSGTPTATPGSPNVGGKGGPGPTYEYLVPSHRGQGPFAVTLVVAATGPDGASPSGSAPPAAAIAVVGLTPTPNLIQLTDDDFAQNCSIEQMRKALATAELDYQNDDLANALPRLAWVSAVAARMPRPNN